MRADKRSKVLFKFDPAGPDWGEALLPCDTPFTVLPLEAGLVGLVICKDVFEAPISELLHRLDLDWLLVPSMTDKLGNHHKKTEDLHKQSGTVSVVANQAMPGGQHAADAYPFGYVQRSAVDFQSCADLITVVEVGLPGAKLRIVK